MTFTEYKEHALANNSALKAEYEALEPDYQVITAVIAARIKYNLSQKELAEQAGTSYGNIVKLENGTLNPSIAFLKKVAATCDMRLCITFQ